ncbi:sodium channel protein type 4 subunit alpha isoform X1 [Lingula anatina]|uniref:Sodium channel protein type 4 subunit alpha isoform X1 n=1 Tax=Lingula anatina TaxID=7574 RepID=A0A1S3JPF0_LINAN|nr:sodium channel protein type 4 subunit alpha isoform X1 [Lingula anatina]|eukprot:XP_013412227.1 sodium channel protein type 4 subunit alpha isoform X1 [Lingula anatina]
MSKTKLWAERRESSQSNKVSETETDESFTIKLAAAHIEDAIHGRAAYGKAKAIQSTPWMQRCFQIVSNKWYNRFLVLNVIVHSCLVAWEPTQIDEPAGSTHPVVFVIGFVCLAIYVADLVFSISFFTWKSVKDFKVEETKWLRVECIFITMFIIDYLLLLVQHFIALGGISARIPSPFRCLRLATIFCKITNVAHVFEIALLVLFKIIKFLLIILGFVAVFAAIGIQLFMMDYHYIGCYHRENLTNADGMPCNESISDDTTGSFDNIGFSFIKVFSLLTTSNYPHIMWGAYLASWTSFFYFAVFLYAGLFIATALLLAIIVDEYWASCKADVKRERKQERGEIVKAFNLLDDPGAGKIPVDDEKLFQVFKLLKPNNSRAEIKELIQIMDMDCDGKISNFDCVTMLTDVLHYEFEKVDEEQDKGNKCIVAYRNACKKVFESKGYNWFSVILILIHSALFCMKWYNMGQTEETVVHLLMTSITVILLFDLLLRSVAYSQEMCHLAGLLDIGLISLAVISSGLWYLNLLTEVTSTFSRHSVQLFKGVTTVISALAVLARLPLMSKYTRFGLSVLVNIYPILSDLIMLVFVVLYFYAILGLEIFQESQVDSNYKFEVTKYGCGLGYQTVRCSLINIFQILTTAGWHGNMDAAIVSTTWWAGLYFLSAYIIVNMLIMNLFVAITIEAFNKLSADSGPGSAVMEGRILVGAAPGFTSHTKQKTEAEEEEEEAEDMSNLSLEERNKRLLKRKRRQRKKKHATNTTKVVIPFRKKNEDEINLHAGEEVEILEKNGAMWKGRVGQEKMGWFPAKCVKEFTVNKKTEVAPTIQAQSLTGGSQTEDEDNMIDSVKLKLAKPVAPQSNWRRQLVGNMTVMNPDELMELNQLSKAKISPASVKKNRISPDNYEGVDVIHEEDEPEEHSDFNMGQHSAAATYPPKSALKRTERMGSVDNATPSNNNDIPDWVKKFSQQHNIALVEGGKQMEETAEDD